MPKQPIPNNAGPAPAGQVPTFGAAGIFTGYANPPKVSSTVPPTTPAPVTPPKTPTTGSTTPVVPPAPTPSAQGTGTNNQGQSSTQANSVTDNYGITPNTNGATYTDANGQQFTVQNNKIVYSSGANAPANPLNPNLPDQEDERALQQASIDYQKQATAVQTAIENITNGSTPLNAGEQAQIDSLKQSFQQLIDAQNLTNVGASGTASIRGYQGGAAEYDPSFSVKTIGSVVSAGQQKVATLQSQEAAAVAQLTANIQANDIAGIKSAWDVYNQAYEAKTDALKQTVADTSKAIAQAQTDFYNQVTKPINDIAATAAQNGAPQSVLSAIGNAASPNEAVQAASGYMQTATGQLGDYLQYQKDAKSQGLTPMDYTTWKAQDDANQNKLAAQKAYQTSYNSEAGKAAADNQFGVSTDTGTGTIPNTGATGITQATGLSLQAFNYLTQGTSSLSRLSAAQRNQIMSEANNFLNKNGIDISTFQSQYKAYNDVLQKNIERANNTQIFAGEITGTADQFITDVGNEFSNLKPVAVADLLLKGQTNDKTAQKYAFDLQTLQNDLAGYYAASRGASQPDDSDLRAASNVITNGLSGQGAQAFKESIQDNEQKVTNVVNQGVNTAQKQVWGLFGVGGQYQPKVADPSAAVNSFVQKNPTMANTISSMYEVPGTTDQDVWDYLQTLNQ